MRHKSFPRLAALLTATALLGACGALGGQAARPTSAPADQPNLQATVAAQVQATMGAQATVAAVVQATVGAIQPTTIPLQPTNAPAAPTQPAAPTAPAVATQPAAPTAAPAAPAAPNQPANGPTGGSGAPLAIAFGSNGIISTLTGAGWQPAFATSDRLRQQCSYTSRVGFDASGTIYVSCGSVYTSQDGITWKRLEERLPGDLVFGPRGQVASVGLDEVKILTSGAWRSYKAADATKEEQFPNRTAAFMPDGTLYLGGYNSKGSQLVSFDGTSWKTYGRDVGAAGGTGPDVLLATSKGELYAAASGHLHRWDGTSFKDLYGTDAYIKLFGYNGNQIYGLQELPGGEVVAATENGIMTFTGGNLALIDQRAGLPSNEVRSLAVDGQGRLWAATSYGLAVRTGDAWQVAQPGTSAIGESDLMALAVRGAPQLPPAAQSPQTATIVGRVTRANVPLGNATVELCTSRSQQIRDLSGATFCANQAYTQKTTADAQGNYRFENVPLGSYIVVITAGDRVTRGTTLNVVALKAGQTYTNDLNY